MSEFSVLKKNDSALWRMNSVQWLKENRSYLLVMADKPAPEMLLRAISLENYLDVETDISHIERGLPVPVANDYFTARRQAVATWSESKHWDMISFFSEGGYEARKAKLVFEHKSRTMRDKREESARLVMRDESGKALVDELEVVEGVQPRSGMRLAGMKRRPGAVSGAADDDLADAIMYGSKEAGSW